MAGNQREESDDPPPQKKVPPVTLEIYHVYLDCTYNTTTVSSSIVLREKSRFSLLYYFYSGIVQKGKSRFFPRND